MFKVYCKIVLVLLVVQPGWLFAQSITPYQSGPLYHAFEQPGFFIGKNKPPYVNTDTINLKVAAANDIQLIIDGGLANNVFGVRLDHTPMLNLTEACAQLSKLPRLTSLAINDPVYPAANDKQYRLPPNFINLQQLTEVSFGNAHKLDMADALAKLAALKRLQQLAITGTDQQLPASITNFKNLKKITLSATNIGTNDLSSANWENVGITIGALQPFVIGAPPPKPLAGDTGLLNLTKVKSLKQLDIYLPYLKDTGVLFKLTQVTKLSISGSGTTSVAVLGEVGKLKGLTSLSIRLSNRKDAISLSALQNLSGLKNLSVSGSLNTEATQVKDLAVLADFREIETLSMPFCNITSLPDIFYDLPALKLISLPINKLSTLPISLFNLQALTSLDLNGNELLELPQADAYHCDQLKALNLRNNSLTTLPSAITTLRGLTDINLSENNLTTATSGWENLRQLKFVNLAQNQLQEFPGGLQNNGTVERIELYSNQIATMPDIAAGKYQLKYLGLSNNFLVSIPEHINRYTKMHSLSLAHNKLKSLPLSFNTYKNITEINLDGSIAAPMALPPGLKHANNLNYISLAGNPLLDKQSIFDFIFYMPRKNFFINLSGNGLTELPATPKWSMIQFRSIDLGNNRLTTLPTELALIQSHSDVGLYGNPFKIDPTFIKRLGNRSSFKIFFDELGTPLPKNYIVQPKEYAAELTAQIHDLLTESKWSKVVEYADKALKADSATYARNVYFNMVGIARIHTRDYRGGIKDLRQYLIDLENHKYAEIYALDDASECMANAYLALNEPEEAAKIYATMPGLDNVLKAFKINGDTAMVHRALDLEIARYKSQMEWHNEDKYDPDKFTMHLKFHYPPSLLMSYASILIVANRPAEAIETLNKDIDNEENIEYVQVKDLLSAAANYLTGATTLNKIKSDLAAAIAQHGKMKQRWVTPFNQWLPYSAYPAKQKEILLELEAMAK